MKFLTYNSICVNKNHKHAINYFKEPHSNISPKYKNKVVSFRGKEVEKERSKRINKISK